jgi:hypothetical protein
MKNKIKKIIPYLLILIILVGGLIPTSSKAQKYDPTVIGDCVVTQYGQTTTTPQSGTDCSIKHGDWYPLGTAPKQGETPSDVKGTCVVLQSGEKTTTQETQTSCAGKSGQWYKPGTTPPADNIPEAPKPAQSDGNAILDNLSCNILTNIPGCLVYVVYVFFYGVPSLILTYVAQFFNAMVSIGLSTKMLSGSSFISTGWAVVRDLSNLFFIVGLLWIAFQTILGMGGHGTKEMIGKIIIMALLINFSMFFTNVIIDSSNILASIFYNKIEVTTKKADGSPGQYVPVTNIPGEKTFLEVLQMLFVLDTSCLKNSLMV